MSKFVEDFLARIYGEEVHAEYISTIESIHAEICELSVDEQSDRDALLRKADDLINIKRIWGKGYFNEYLSAVRTRNRNYEDLKWKIDMSTDSYEKKQLLGQLSDINRNFLSDVRELVRKDQKEEFVIPKREPREDRPRQDNRFDRNKQRHQRNK